MTYGFSSFQLVYVKRHRPHRRPDSDLQYLQYLKSVLSHFIWSSCIIFHKHTASYVHTWHAIPADKMTLKPNNKRTTFKVVNNNTPMKHTQIRRDIKVSKTVARWRRGEQNENRVFRDLKFDEIPISIASTIWFKYFTIFYEVIPKSIWIYSVERRRVRKRLYGDERTDYTSTRLIQYSSSQRGCKMSFKKPRFWVFLVKTSKVQILHFFSF